jgi:hypothetical protein
VDPHVYPMNTGTTLAFNCWRPIFNRSHAQNRKARRASASIARKKKRIASEEWYECLQTLP